MRRRMVAYGLFSLFLAVFMCVPGFAADVRADALAAPAEEPALGTEKLVDVDAEPVQPAPNKKQQVLLIIPARYTIVQLAFDINRIRPLAMVTYDDQAPASEPILYSWDNEIRDWIRIDRGQLKSGSFLDGNTPSELVVVGADDNLPEGLLKATKWCPAKKRVAKLSLATIANTLNETLKFSPREWRWLAQRYGLKLKDLNANRRRYGRYGRHETRDEDKLTPMPQPVPDTADKELSPIPIGTGVRDPEPELKPRPEPVEVEDAKTLEPIPLPEDK